MTEEIIYSAKEEQALASFFGDVEHLKILQKDLLDFFDNNGEVFTTYDADQKIELEFRLSLYFSFFHVCLEYMTRTKFKTAIEKQHSNLAQYLSSFNTDLYENLKKYRNKSFHENADLNADINVKMQLDVKNKFKELHDEVNDFLKSLT